MLHQRGTTDGSQPGKRRFQMRNCSLFVSVVCLLLVSSAAVPAGRRQGQSERKNTVVESKSIPAEVKYEFSREVGPGRLLKAQDGKAGEVRRTYEIIHTGKAVERKLIKEERVEPKPAVFLMGRAGFKPSRGG